MTIHIANWATRKTQIALAMASGQCGAGYSEAMLVLSSTISGIASAIWPGSNVPDKKRFVELWATHCLPSQNLISVPLLYQHLNRTKNIKSSIQIERAFPEFFGPGYQTRVLLGTEVDLTEERLLHIDLTLSNIDMRQHSYANLFYKHVRSCFSHEYELTQHASEYRMAIAESGVSYVNKIHQGIGRLIHFEPQWMADLVHQLSHSVSSSLFERQNTTPQLWWIDGRT
jgi:hypothetical protein